MPYPLGLSSGREAKAEVTDLKKDIIEAQKAFAKLPLNGEAVKEYDATLGEYAKVTKAAAKLENKLTT